MEYKEAKGKLTEKIPNEKDKGPKGHFRIDGIRYAVWSGSIWDKYKEGDDVEINYYDKHYEMNGSTLISKNLTNIKYLGEERYQIKEKDMRFNKKEKSILEKEGVDKDGLSNPETTLIFQDSIIKFCGIRYKIKRIELEIVRDEEEDGREHQDNN